MDLANTSIPPRLAALRSSWLLPVLSTLGATGIALFLARRSYQVDIDVYLMGGKHLLRDDLYSVYFGRPFLLFTYPPFAALVFVPLASVALVTVQTVWSLVNLGVLFALIATTTRLLRPTLVRSSVIRISLTALLPALLLYPVFLTVGLGQINLVLCLAVLWDLVGPRRLGRYTIPQGVATGVAAAVKLTPLIFLPYLVLTGQRRGAVAAALTFALCSGLGFAVAPQMSWAYWSHYVLQSKRAGALLEVSDQNIISALSRFDHRALSMSELLPLLAVVAVVGLVVAASAHRRSSPLLGVLVCAATGLLISPISWSHHLVWVLPAIAWLGFAEDRPRYGGWWAAGTAVLFWSVPILWVPTSWWPSADPVELSERGWQLVAGNSFFLALVAFLVSISGHLWRSRPLVAGEVARSSGAQREQEPSAPPA